MSTLWERGDKELRFLRTELTHQITFSIIKNSRLAAFGKNAFFLETLHLRGGEKRNLFKLIFELDIGATRNNKKA